MDLSKALHKEGMHARLVPMARMKDVQRDILEMRESGQIDPVLYETYFSGYSYTAPESLPEARSLIVVAVPSPTLLVRFETEDGIVETIVPPTYSQGKEVDRRVKEAMQRAMPKARFERVFLPVKILAARTGLMRYGRNNNVYMPMLGSFFRLTSFVSDLECTAHEWGEMKLLPACKKCTKCREACPTQAIVADRFVIRAERCLTYLNEMPSERGFPAWVSPKAHNSIQGCMVCQQVCPYDRAVAGHVEAGPTFSRMETKILLETPEQASPELGEKLASLGMKPSLFPRNLTVLMHRG
ncbi:MAG: 4Fe-4S double cluster binding domain-containing protein [Methanomassiliicoccales archaeon]